MNPPKKTVKGFAPANATNEPSTEKGYEAVLMARVASKDPNVEVQLTSEMLNQPLLDIPNPIPKSFSYSHFGFDAETFAVDGTNPLPRPPGSYKDSQGNSFARRMSTSASREFDTGISRQSFKKSLDDMFFPPKGANPSVKKQSADSLHLVEENSTRSATVSKLVAGGSETPDSGASRSRSNSVVLTPAGSPRSSPKPPANNKKKLSKSESRELQEKQRAEKAARNAAMGVVPKSAKSKQDESKTKANTRAGNKNVAVAENQASRQNVPKRRPKQPEDHGIASALKQSTLLSHLPIWEKYSADPKQFGLVHPAVMTLARHFAELTITGSNARCLAMLLTFKKVITDYVTPPSLTLQRDLLQHLSRQVDFINRSRSLATSMRTAVRFLKTVISQSPIETPDSDARVNICNEIDVFISEHITLAAQAIYDHITKGRKIKNGDVIMIYARSSLVLGLLLAAYQEGIRFRVIVVDSRPYFEGKDTCKKLLNAGIACSFIMTHAVPYLIKEATKIIVGASAVMTNGDIMGRVGTALICMAAHDNRIPVVALCESYKFADGLVRLDSFVWNELGDPDLLVDTSNRSMAEKFYDGADKDLIRHAGALREWNSAPQLLLVNLHYDITPAKFVTMLACEHGLIPSTLVASVSSMAL